MSVPIRRDEILRLLDGHMVRLESGHVLKPEEHTPWQPLERIPVPEAMRVQQATMSGDRLDELWCNPTYEVMVYYMTGKAGLEDFKAVRIDPRDGGVHLSIKRYDRAAVRNWRHFQQIKNEIAGPEREAMELFPRESRLADNANQYHLWVAPADADIPVGWEQGMVLIEDDEVQAYNDAPHGGRQEPRQEGLTVGDTLQGARLPEQAVQVRRILGIK